MLELLTLLCGPEPPILGSLGPRKRDRDFEQWALHRAFGSRSREV